MNDRVLRLIDRVQAVEQTLGKVRTILEHAAHHLRSQRPAGAAGIRAPS